MNAAPDAAPDAEFPGEELEEAFHPPPTLLERACMVICEFAIGVMAFIVILEIVTRNLFNFSFEMSEELGGYIIIGITFLSLPVCQVYRAYHHVQFIQTRLSPRLRAAVAFRVRRIVAGVLRHPAGLATDALRAAVLAIGRRSADVAGHAAVDSADPDADRHTGGVGVAAALRGAEPAPLHRGASAER